MLVDLTMNCRAGPGRNGPEVPGSSVPRERYRPRSVHFVRVGSESHDDPSRRRPWPRWVAAGPPSPPRL